MKIDFTFWDNLTENEKKLLYRFEKDRTTYTQSLSFEQWLKSQQQWLACYQEMDNDPNKTWEKMKRPFLLPMQTCLSDLMDNCWQPFLALSENHFDSYELEARALILLQSHLEKQIVSA